MRYGILADVHGNLPALRAVLRALEDEGVEQYLVAGDLVGYGPWPNECVELVAGLRGVCVAGNHDLIALGRLSGERCIPLARRILDWTRGVLGDESRAYLEGLPLRAEAPGGVVFAHGSLDDPERYVTRPAEATGQLDELARDDPEARVLVLGHTHRAWVFPGETSTPFLLNPGAVGQSRELELRPRARFALLDLDRGELRMHAIRYDDAACRGELRRLGFPAKACHLRPSPLRAAVRALRRRAYPV